MATATACAKEIIEQVNSLRSNPSGYASKLERYTKYFTDKVLKVPDINVQIRTQEGDAPYKETIDYLKNQQPVEPLVASKGLCKIAEEILAKIVDSDTGEIDESETEEIIDKHGNFSGKFTRAMDFGGFTSEQVVINFVVCDGDPDRTQREPLLGNGLKKVGVAFGKHNIYSTVCVLVSCTEFTNTHDSDDIPVFPPTKKELEIQKQKEEEKQREIERQKEEEKQKELEKQREIEKQKELEKQKEDKAKAAEEEKKRKEEERKREIQRRKEEAEKRREEAKKKEANKTVSNPFQLPKKKFFSSYKVPKNELPEGVVEMTVIDKGIGFIDGKRHHRFVHNKVMADGSKVSEEVNKCLD
jgi:hypothetical protein